MGGLPASLRIQRARHPISTLAPYIQVIRMRLATAGLYVPKPTHPEVRTLREGNDYTVYDGYVLGTSKWFKFDEGRLDAEYSASKVAEVVAIKRMRDTAVEAAEKLLKFEVSNLLHIPPHPNLLHFFGYDNEAPQLVFEFAERTLQNLFEDSYTELANKTSNLTSHRPVIGARQWIYIAHTLLSGIAHLHENGFIHSNLNPNNILLRKEPCRDHSVFGHEPIYTVVLSDFASALPNGKGMVVGSELEHNVEDVFAMAPFVWDVDYESYMAPDFLRFIEDTTRPIPPLTLIDMHSAGCSLLAAAIGTSPFTTSTTPERHLGEAGRIRQFLYANNMDPLEFAQKSDERSLRCEEGGFVAMIVRLCLSGREAEGVKSLVMPFVANEWKKEGSSDNAWFVPTSKSISE